jgi:hypothetical protein
MIRYLLNRLAWILALGTLIAGVAWLNAYDRDVAAASAQQYCADVALWNVEARRGIGPTQRTGHPDYRGIAAKQCPGRRPANSSEITTRSTERQLTKE